MLLALILSSLAVQDDPASLDHFERKVRPVLVEHCYGCHSETAGKAKGGLRLDTRDALRKGGESGPALVPGDPEKSLLLKAVRYQDDGLRMPPKRKLPDAVVDDLARWIKDGATDPRSGAAAVASKGGVTLDEGRKHWAFRPIAAPPLPPGDGHPVDRFIDTALRARGLVAAPTADRRTLIRRITFDLAGLPPSPEEVEAFVADAAPDAYEKVVDRLLASPRYGERWGRHWLDLVRYADSNGVDEDVTHPHAWRYRDWVVRALNEDLPYDRFVVAQLAGDLSGDPVPTGWLAMGPKMLAEPDLEKMKLDIADEQIDVATKTFLGLTVTCARCHDHKFDPVAMPDYYALAGIFRSIGIITDYSKRPAILYEAELPGPDNDAKRAEFKAKVDALKAEIGDKPSKEQKENLKKLEAHGPDLPRTMAVRETGAVDLPVHLRGSHLNLAKEKTLRGFPRVFEISLEPPPVPPNVSGRAELARWLVDPAHPLPARVMVNRIWQGHFGEGLVRTPSNFGLKGEAPTHPELLDWLASDFVRGNWSMKRLHRAIVTSSAYRRSTSSDAARVERDPDNRLLARQSRRRLEAEAVRDALLAAGGTLDLEMGGFVKGMPRDSGYWRAGDEAYAAPRRTVYLPVPRHKTYDLLAIFDYADTAVHQDKRPVTIVPQQALFMLNSPLVRSQAAALAAEIEKAGGNDADRVRRLWLRLFARPATDEEASRVLREAGRIGWKNVAHALFASNEFLFVD